MSDPEQADHGTKPGSEPRGTSAAALVHPVVLSVIRVFALIQLVIQGATGVAFAGHSSPMHATTSVMVMFGLCLAVLLYSLLPSLGAAKRGSWVQGWFSMPLALGVLLAIPPLVSALAFLRGTPAFEKMALEQAMFVAVPLLIVAWQYSFRTVVALCLLTGGLDVALALLSDIGHERGEVYLHVLLSRTVGLLIASYVVSRLASEQRLQHRSLERAHVQLTRFAGNLERLTVSRERNRVARELHDTLAHTLSAMTVQLEAVRTSWGDDPARSKAMIDKSHAMARDGLAEVRRALHSLRSSVLDDLGLSLAILHVAQEVRDRMGIDLEVSIAPETQQLAPSAELGVFRIAQELLANVERHSRASRVRLGMRSNASRFILTIDDDGCGFDPGRVASDRYGIQGVRERAQMLGATIRWDTAPDQGTCVTLELDGEIPASGAA